MSIEMITVPPHGGRDPDFLNSDRAQWAQSAIEEFMRLTGSDDETAISDLIGDLMHLCHARGVDFATELQKAFNHFEAETGDGKL